MKAAAFISLSQQSMQSRLSSDEGWARFGAMLNVLWRIGYHPSASWVLTDSPLAVELCTQHGIGVELIPSDDFAWNRLAAYAAESDAEYVSVFSSRCPELVEAFAARLWPFMREGNVQAAVPTSARQYFSMDFWRGTLATGVRRVFRKPPISSPRIFNGARICRTDTWERLAGGEPLRAMMVPCAEADSGATLILETRQEGVWEIVAPAGTNFEALIERIGRDVLEDIRTPILVLEEDRGELMNMPLIWNQSRSYLAEPAALDDLPKPPVGPEDVPMQTGLFRQSALCRFHRTVENRGPAYWDDDSKGIKFGSELGDLPGDEPDSTIPPERILSLQDLYDENIIPLPHDTDHVMGARVVQATLTELSAR